MISLLVRCIFVLDVCLFSGLYFLVGAGTSGCVLAARLSEKFNVLLLEAGGPPPPAVSVPLYVDDVVYSQPINYFFSVPQHNGVIFPISSDSCRELSSTFFF